MRLAEIAKVLARHGGMRASITFDPSGGYGIYRLSVDQSGNASVMTARFELQEDVQRLIDLEQLRTLVKRYDVPPDQLVAFLTKE